MCPPQSLQIKTTDKPECYIFLLMYTILDFERKCLNVYKMLETSVRRSTFKHSSGRESSAVRETSLV